MTKRLLVLIALLCGYATAQYIPVVGSSCIRDASGSLIASGTFTVQATDDQNRPLAFRIGSTIGQAITAPVVWYIGSPYTTAGTLNAGGGTLQLADPTQTQPLNIKYHFSIKNLATGNITNYSLITVSVNDGAGHFDFCRMNPFLGSSLVTALQGATGAAGSPCPSGGACSLTNTGVFTNTPMNLYLQALINSLNPQTEFQLANPTGSNTSAIVGGVAIPNTSSVTSGSGVLAFVNNSSGPSGTNGIGINGYCRNLVNASKCWGANFVAFDTLGLTSNVLLAGLEVDVQPQNGTSTYTGSGGVAGIESVLYGSTSGNYGGQAYTVSTGGTGSPQWGIGFASNDASTATGFYMGSTANAASSPSQTFQISMRDSGNIPRTATFNYASDGFWRYALSSTGGSGWIFQTSGGATALTLYKGGTVQFPETASIGGVLNNAMLRADVVSHRLKMNLNNTGDKTLAELESPAFIVQTSVGDGTFGSNQTNGVSACETSFGITALSIGAVTTDTGLNCLPLNAVIDAVVYRITTTITTAVSFTIGDGTTAARFCGTQSTLAAGTIGTCFAQADQTGTTGPRQTSAAKVRVTLNVNPGAGAIRLIVYYHTWTAPTS